MRSGPDWLGGGSILVREVLEINLKLASKRIYSGHLVYPVLPPKHGGWRMYMHHHHRDLIMAKRGNESG